MYSHNVLIGLETNYKTELDYTKYFTETNQGKVVERIDNILFFDDLPSRYLLTMEGVFDLDMCKLLDYFKKEVDSKTYYMIVYDTESEVMYEYGSLDPLFDMEVESEIITKYSIGYTLPTPDELEEDEEVVPTTPEESDVQEQDIEIIEQG